MSMTLVSRNNMNMGINLPTATVDANPSKEKECGNCGAHSAHFLYQVRLVGVGKLRRLCTSCVLRLHRSSFCPVCFAFYGGSPPHPSKRIACTNCPSFTHSHCAGDTLLSSYLCPPCKDSSFSFFPLKDNKIDNKLALPLLCAAKIAASSMGKYATVAWAEADRKVREAALARKRAREALDHLLHLTANAQAKDIHMDDADGDGDIDVDLVRHIEDSLVKDEDVDSKFD